jgi:hypothetical protein
MIVMGDIELGPVIIEHREHRCSEHYVQVLTDKESIDYELEQAILDAKMVFASSIVQLLRQLDLEEERWTRLWR